MAGVSVPLGGAVSTAQIASALTGSGYKLTDNDTTYTLTKSGSTITLTGSNGSKTSVTDSNTTYTLGSFGITATAAEINKLDGLATTAAELGYVHGVTSSIQTQLNAKANASALAAYALKDGSNASGTWPISVSGIANCAVYLTSTYTGRGGLQPPSYFNGMGLKVNMMNKPVAYCDVIFVNGYNGIGSDVPYVNALAFQKTANAHGEVYHARGDYGGSSWGTWYKFLDEYNFASILDTRYLLKSSYTASDVLAKLKTVDGSGSGLDADLLDGYHSISFDLATNLGACQDYGVYVIGLMQITDYTTEGNMANGTLIFVRQNGNNPAQKIIYSLSSQYSSTNVRFGFVTLSNNIYVQPCTFTYNGKKWAGFQVSAASSYSTGVVCVRDGLRLGERSTPFLLKYGVSNTGAVINSEVNSSVVINGADIIESGVFSNNFMGSLSGNATSATKLATARTLWGQSFNGTGNVSGDMTGVGWINSGLNISIFGSNSDNSDTTRFLMYGHRVEFGGPGYAHVNYYLRPRYGASGETYAGVYIQNASAAASPVFSTTHYFDHNGNAYHWGNLGLGVGPSGYKLAVAGTGGFTGRIFAHQGVTIGTTDGIGWYLSSSRIAAGSSTARGVNVGSLLVSNAWADAGKVPTNGIYSKGGIYSDGYVSAKGQDTTSDARYKRDIAALPAQSAIAVLGRLRPSTWEWRDDGRRGAGFVAQEVLGVLPEAVREVGDGEDRHLALNYQMLHAYEVAALQTHEDELERLRGRVNQLENEIKRIRHGS